MTFDDVRRREWKEILPISLPLADLSFEQTILIFIPIKKGGEPWIIASRLAAFSIFLDSSQLFKLI